MADVKFIAEAVERRPTDALVPYARNARTHSPEQVSQIAASMREFGWTYPVLVDEADGIIAGHGRVLAAQKLKLPEVPVMVARGWSEAQKKAYILADNRISLGAGWDEALLRVELGDLQASGFDLSLTGFSSLELTGLFSTQDGNTDPDDVLEAPAQPVSQAGDVWQLGPHVLVCGDCTDPVAVAKAMAGAKPHLMVTDPPYGVNYDPTWRDKVLGEHGRSSGAVQNDHKADWREAWALFPGDVAYVWHGGTLGKVVQESLEAVGFDLRFQIIWRKQHFTLSRGHYHLQHESCFYLVRKGGTGHWAGGRKQSTVWEMNNGLSQGGGRSDVDKITGHGTQKPVEAMARPIRNNSAVGDRIYEPFAGSGTTIIAAQMNKRICHAMELSPAYVDVCCTRFASFSGVAPVLVETDETFDQVKARRLDVV